MDEMQAGVTATQNAPRFVKTTLGELGARLPIGVLVGDRFVRNLAARRFDFAAERKLGETRSKAKGRVTPGAMIGGILAQLCEQVGPHRLGEMKDNERLVALGQMHTSDVIYAVAWSRVQALGGTIDVQLSCDRCDETSRVTIDLNDLEVTALAGDEAVDLSFETELRDGFPCRGSVVRRLTLEPVRWWALDSPALAGEARQNPSTVNACLLASAIRALDGTPVTLTADDLNEMTVYDAQGLAMDMDERTPGPRFTVEVSCPVCGRPNSHTLNWMDAGFFRRSSRSRASRS